MTAGDDIWQAIRASNAAWTSGNPRAVAALFADDVVMVAPGLAGRVEGREAIVQSYVDYCRDVHEESGQEILVFARREGRWQAIWRTQIPHPAQQE